MMDIRKLPEFEMAEQLRDEEDMAAYLTMVLENGDMEELVRAIGHIAKARGMPQLAKESGLSRTSLYKTFSPGSKPQFETINKVVHALGFDLRAVKHEGDQRAV